MCSGNGDLAGAIGEGGERYFNRRRLGARIRMRLKLHSWLFVVGLDEACGSFTSDGSNNTDSQSTYMVC